MRMISTLCLGVALSMPVAFAAMAEDQASTITVTGEGVSESAPDIATISIGVTTQGTTAAEAMDANSAALQAVLDRLRAAGIEARDLQTSNLSLNPNWQGYDNGDPPKITGYVAANILNVRVRKLDGLGEVLDAVVTDGANTLNGITFGLTDPRPAVDAARTEAVQDARARATLLVGAAGAQLGRVISITEGGGYAPPQPMYRMEADAAASVPVAGGEVGVTANVTMVFEITQD